jgi:hypothetical protein
MVSSGSNYRVTGGVQMSQYQIRQIVMCKVFVWRTVEAETLDEVVAGMQGQDAPTSINGVDYEIIDDVRVINTEIRKLS